MEPRLNNQSETQSSVDVSYSKAKIRRREYQQLFVSFGLMMVLTIIAFIAIQHDGINNSFALPFILLLAAIQVAIQLFIFMHLKEKGNFYTIAFFTQGLVFAMAVVAGLMLLIWW